MHMLPKRPAKPTRLLGGIYIYRSFIPIILIFILIVIVIIRILVSIPFATAPPLGMGLVAARCQLLTARTANSAGGVARVKSAD